MANEDKKIVTVEGLEKVREKLDERYVLEGEYSPNTSVGLSRLAENLTPYSSESGTEQDIPFILQGTGCGNGATQVDTGSYAQITAKKGNVVVANQLIEDEFGASTAYWTKNRLSQSNSDNIATFTTTSNAYSFASVYHAYSAGTLRYSHKYWITAQVRVTSGLCSKLSISFGSEEVASVVNPTLNQWYTLFAVAINNNADSSSVLAPIFQRDYSSVSDIVVNSDTFQVRKVKMIDLTLMYGNNAWIPSDLLSHPENFFRYYQGSLAYDTGSWSHANGRYLITTGRNIWNEQWVKGYITDAGNIDGGYNNISSKDYISVIPNTTYHIHTSYSIAGQSIRIAWYDVNKNLIEVRNRYSVTVTAPANAIYMRFSLHTTYGITYKNDTTISEYYTGESGYNEHYPYEELDNIDTGTEDLLQAGEVSDTKAKDGTITHNLVEINLSEKTWTLVEDVGYWYFVGSSPSNIRSVGSANLPNAHSDKYVTVKMNDAGLSNNTFAIDNQFILVRTSSTSVTPTGTIIAELDEPTTEQGTPYESTLNINDFGTMYWLTNDNATPSVPQGIEIFYPVDYKAYIDTLYNHTDGDASNVATTDELGEKETELKAVDTILQNAIGGTLRQLLAISKSIDFLNTDVLDLGSLNYNYDSSGHFFYCGTPAEVSAGTNALSTMYKVIAEISTASQNNMEVQIRSSTMYIKNSEYTSTDTFKTAMKGVLLAYEKA